MPGSDPDLCLQAQMGVVPFKKVELNQDMREREI